jgi:membrane protein implicated in regulation of membrane protease activity
VLDSLELFAIIVLIIIVLGIVAWYLWSIGWALTKRPFTGPESLIGKTGVVITPPEQNKTGEVNIDGIIWKAKLSDDEQMGTARIAIGNKVVVVGYSALTVVVKKTKS